VFITLEGIDRSGKTTQAALLARELGGETLLLREPGGTPLGERVRELLMDPGFDLGAGAEVLLFCAARAELVRQVVWPAKEAGRDIVCDRFIDSTVAYQGIARGLELERVEELNALVVGSCLPDLTVLLRIDPDEAERRGQQRLVAGVPDGADRFEGAGIEFQRAVAAAYDELAARHPERIRVVDGSGEINEVHARVMETVAARRPTDVGSLGGE
jgi:dTMP kinase